MTIRVKIHRQHSQDENQQGTGSLDHIPSHRPSTNSNTHLTGPHRRYYFTWKNVFDVTINSISSILLISLIISLSTTTGLANQCIGTMTVFTDPIDRKITNPSWCWTYTILNNSAYRHFYARAANTAGCLSANGLFRVRCNETYYVLGPAYYCPSVPLGEIHVTSWPTGSSDGHNPDACYLDYSGYQQLTRCNEYYNAGERWVCPPNWQASNRDTDGNITRCYQCSNIDPKKNLGNNPVSSCQNNSQYVGNPINSATGNKYQSESDYQSAGNPYLKLTRHYNSKANSSSFFGANWNAFSTIRVVDAHNLTVIRPDQRALNYYLLNSEWISDADIDDKLSSIGGGYRITTVAGDVEDYDATGKLLSLTDHAGRTLTLNYDATGKPLFVIDNLGRSLSFSYDSLGRIVTMTDPAGEDYSYAYDNIGNLISVTYPDGTTRYYHYEDSRSPHALTGISDENGHRYATYTYDEQGRAISSEHANGAGRVELAYNADGSTTVTDAIGTARTHGFKNILGVVKNSSTSQPGGAGCDASSSGTSYDANGNIASRDDFNGHRTRYWHDLERNLETARVEGLAVVNGSEQVRPETRTITTTWHAGYRLPILEKLYTGGADSAGKPTGILIKTTSYTYDPQGNLTTLSETDDIRHQTRTRNWTYTTLGRILSADGPRTDVADQTTYAYYPDDDPNPGRRGQLRKITNALGHETEILDYDLHGHPIRILDPNGLITELAYDARGRLITRVVGTRVTAYAYDAAGNLTGLTLPDGGLYTFAYDAAHRLTDIRNAQGEHIRYSLDGLGNIVAETLNDAQGHQARRLTRQYDALGRLWKEIRRVNGQDAVTEYGYDAQGNPTLRADPLNHASQNRYDALGRLAQTEDALQGRTNLALNALDTVNAVTDPNGHATRYETDAFGQVRKETSPDRGITTYTYDAAGNLKTRTDARGTKLTFRYDALNRLIRINRPTGVDTIYTWDQGTNGLGRLTGMKDESGTTNWSYNPYGDPTGKTQTHNDGLVRNVGFTILNGRRTRIDYPSGAYAEYTWSQGRIVSISVNGAPLLNSIQYQPFGAAISWTWGNGQHYTQNQDPETGWTLSYPLGADTRTLDYDAAGRISGYSHNRPRLDQRFDYDPLDRLTGISTFQGSTTYQYDANGNRTAQNSSATDYPYTTAADSNRLLSVAGPVAKTYQYDAAGNIIHDGTYAFIYNDFGRLESATWGDKTTRYRYNGLGERLQKSGRGALNGPVRFVYDESGQMLGEYDKTGALQQETIWLENRPVAVVTPTAVLYVYADHLNIPRVLMDTSSVAVWRWNSDAFGVGNASLDPDRDTTKIGYNLRFPGQYFDKETGLHYNHFRDYDPRTGRYVQTDPIGAQGGVNFYNYVRGNPLTLSDPIGLWTLGDPLPQWTVDLASGFGDGVSFGITNIVRNITQTNSSVDQCSSFYNWSRYTGYALGASNLWVGSLNAGANSIFWSGVGNSEKAAQLGKSLELTPLGSIMHHFGEYTPIWLWKVASATYAANAKGTATKIGIESGNIWRTVERPILEYRGIKINILP